MRRLRLRRVAVVAGFSLLLFGPPLGALWLRAYQPLTVVSVAPTAIISKEIGEEVVLNITFRNRGLLGVRVSEIGNGAASSLAGILLPSPGSGPTGGVIGARSTRTLSFRFRVGKCADETVDSVVRAFRIGVRSETLKVKKVFLARLPNELKVRMPKGSNCGTIRD